MLIKNLVSWAGPRFSYEPGDIIEADDATARARIEAGVAVEHKLGEAIEPTIHKLPPREAPPAEKPARSRAA
jgi:hypothetical protein